MSSMTISGRPVASWCGSARRSGSTVAPEEIAVRFTGRACRTRNGSRRTRPRPKARRFWLDEAIRLVDRLETAESINRGLQVRRLERIRNVGVLAVFLLIGFAPILVSGSSQALWARTDPGEAMQVTAWLTTLGIGLLGAIGALLSGLLQVRSSPVTFADYEVRGIEVALRVLVGAAVAVTVYYLLSWRAVPIDVTSAGTFLLVAFMSGFSERFFLKLLGLDAAALADSDHVEAGGHDPSPDADGSDGGLGCSPGRLVVEPGASVSSCGRHTPCRPSARGRGRAG